MRTVTEVLTDHQAAMRAYAQLAQDGNATQAQVQTAAKHVTELGQELSTVISAGAAPCETCDGAPIGMIKTPAYFANGVEVPAVYEVGCVFCPPYVVPNEDRGVVLMVKGEPQKVLRRSYSARATDPAEAVRKWNDGEWVEDTLFDRVPGFTPVYHPTQ